MAFLSAYIFLQLRYLHIIKQMIINPPVNILTEVEFQIGKVLITLIL